MPIRVTGPVENAEKIRIPTFLATASGQYVLADPKEVYIAEISPSKLPSAPKPRKVETFQKGETSARRHRAHVKRMAEFVSRNPQYRSTVAQSKAGAAFNEALLADIGRALDEEERVPVARPEASKPRHAPWKGAGAASEKATAQPPRNADDLVYFGRGGRKRVGPAVSYENEFDNITHRPNERDIYSSAFDEHRKADFGPPDEPPQGSAVWALAGLAGPAKGMLAANKVTAKKRSPRQVAARGSGKGNVSSLHELLQDPGAATHPAPPADAVSKRITAKGIQRHPGKLSAGFEMCDPKPGGGRKSRLRPKAEARLYHSMHTHIQTMSLRDIP